MRALVLEIEQVDFETQDRLSAASEKIRYATIEAARKYLDGEWDREQTEAWLKRYALTSADATVAC